MGSVCSKKSVEPSHRAVAFAPEPKKQGEALPLEISATGFSATEDVVYGNQISAGVARCGNVLSQRCSLVESTSTSQPTCYTGLAP